jgi:aryl-phospho-beta-D-glucosidase BglC (GH1 family)
MNLKRFIFVITVLALVVVIVFSWGCQEDKLLSPEQNIGTNKMRSTSMPGGRLTGVNWFGFETSNYVVHGLWIRDYKSVLQQISDLGFNCIRLPWCNEMIGKNPNSIQINASGTDPYTGKTGLNLDLEGLSSLEVLDKIIEEAGKLGLKIILDNHSRAANGYMNEELWYTSSYSEAKWISDWEMMANRYRNASNVVGFDLNNEPHGAATWGDGTSSTNWNEAAARCGNAILAIKPDALIIVEGVEKAAVIPDDDNPEPETSVYWYWWGGDLHGVRDYPITSIPAGNLVYSPHEYGPEVYAALWFSDSRFPDQMPGIWDKYFWFIYNEGIAPVLIGEFGIMEASAANPSSTAYKWFINFLEYVGNKASWTLWCVNPNSGDTGGILKDDWVSVETAKYNILRQYLAPQFHGGTTTTTTSATTSTTTTAASTSTTTTAATTSTTTTTSGGGAEHVWLEAECGNVGSLWNTPSDGNASGGTYVTIQSGNNSTSSAPTSSSGHITYNFSVSSSGSYVVWGRVIAPSPNDDSFWMQMDGGSWFNWNNITSSSSWTWDDCQSYSLSAGSHTLTVAYREDGTQLDKIYITNSGDTPSGTGGTATNCGGSTTTTTTAATTSTTTTSATTSTTTTSATTTTTSGTGETCSPVDAEISASFTQNGAGEYCWTATSCSYINSWNLSSLTINGVDFTNKYAFGSNLPAKIDGKWYIHYVGNYSWSHFELR